MARGLELFDLAEPGPVDRREVRGVGRRYLGIGGDHIDPLVAECRGRTEEQGRATQTAPFRPGPLPIISRIQTSPGSEIENDSPVLAYPCSATSVVITWIASRAVRARSSAM